MRRSARAMSGCQLGACIAASNSDLARVSSASASVQRPSSISIVACTLSQWLDKNTELPGADDIRPCRRSRLVQEPARSKSPA